MAERQELSFDPKKAYPTVKDIEVINSRGAWNSKSGGSLAVTLALPETDLRAKFLQYDPEELEMVGEDIRGIRIYQVTDCPLGGIGGTEFHRIRHEFVFALGGQLDWEFEDLSGEKRRVAVEEGRGVYIPPYLLHTYQVQQDRSRFMVFCNTLFNPENPATHDTYSRYLFNSYQANFKP